MFASCVCASLPLSMPPRPLGGGGAAVRPLICSLFLLGPHLVSAAYTCTSVGTECQHRIYTASYSSESAVEAACDADASCKAYDWSATGGLGFKCSTTSTREDHYDEYLFCTKPSKNRTRTTIARTHTPRASRKPHFSRCVRRPPAEPTSKSTAALAAAPHAATALAAAARTAALAATALASSSRTTALATAA